MARMQRKQAKLEEPELSDESFENEYDEKGISEESELEVQIESSLEETVEPQTQYLARQLATTQTEAYNPHQDEKLVLEIRQSYAALREDLNKNNRELVKADSSRLSNLIDQANAVFSKVRTTSDASLDSRFFTDTADLGVEKVHKLPLLVSEFSLDSYLRIVNQYLGTCSWKDLGNLVSSYWAGVETTDFMLGPMELEVKQKKPTTQSQTVKTIDNAPVVKPAVVNLTNNENKSEEMSKETSENVMRVYSVLAEIGSFPLYHFITDPGSFARTVENLFYVSFLIRDSRARIFIPEFSSATNELFIEAVLPDEEENIDNSGDINQMILGMTTKIWQRSIAKYDIKTAFLASS